MLSSATADGTDENDPLVPTLLMIDNQAAMAMRQMPQFTEKQKHIPICMCHLKKCCAEGLVQLYPASFKNELADIGTKALGEDAFMCIKSVITGNVRLSAILSTDPNLERIWLA
jgi:hypothetical protein